MRALRSRALQSDSEISEAKTEESEHTEENVSKKMKRKKLKKRRSDENGQDLDIVQELVVKKKKTKSSKKRITELLDNSMSQENETDTKVLSTSFESDKSENMDENKAVKKRTKKSKKRTAEILDSSRIQENETDTKVSSTSFESYKSENIDENKAVKKRTKKSKKGIAEILDSSRIQENETSNVLSTSNETQRSGNKDEYIARKKKIRKPKEAFAEVQDNEIITKILRTSIKSNNKDENVERKKKIRKPKEAFAEVQDNETTTITLRTSIESKNEDENVERKKNTRKPKEVFSTSSETQKSENEGENTAVMKKIIKSRDFLRSTILNSPNFDNVITSTAVKPKRPELRLEDSDRNKEKEQEKRMSKMKDIKEFNRRETLNVSRNKSLSDTNNSIVQTINKTKTKRSTLRNSIALNKTSNKSFKINSSDKLNESTKIIKRRSTVENSIDTNRDSVSNRRETFCKLPKISNITDNVIAISDSPETSKMTNTFNKSNTVEPELTSDEEIETDDDSLKSSKVKENKVLLVENTVITISDTPDRTVKQNTFNKLVSPEITSDEDEEINEDKQNKSLRMNQSLNCTKTKNNSENNGSFKRNDINYKTPKNICPKSEKIIDKSFDDFNELSDVGESILEDVIDISDTLDKSNIQQNTFNLSDNIANTSITKSERIINTSGDWRVEKSNNIEDVETNLNNTFEVDNKENNSQNSTNIKDSRNSTENYSNTTLKNENVSLSPKDKTFRKKWIKFPRHSSDAKSVLEQISSPKLQKKMNASKIVQQIMNTPTDLFKLQKPPIAPSNLSIQKTNLSVQKTNFSFTKSKSPRKSPLKSIKKPITSASSSKKSATKRTALPNFALIHQKAFEKMENLAEYSERKKQRAQVLLSSNNPGSKRKSSSTTKPKSEEDKLKFSRKLFTNEASDAKFNRFGFKSIEQKKPINIVAKSNNVAIVKPIVKPSVFARSDVVAIANKNKVVTNKRDDRRDAMKGVRTNRRFELLMQMRNK